MLANFNPSILTDNNGKSWLVVDFVQKNGAISFRMKVPLENDKGREETPGPETDTLTMYG